MVPATLVRKRMLILAAVGIFILIMWGLYLLSVLFGLNLVSKNMPPEILLYVAIACTPIAVVAGFVSLRKVQALAARGVETTAQVVSVSMLASHGSSPVTLSYSVDGKAYSVRRDLPRSGYKEGDTVKIIYDPQNPKVWDFA